MTKRPPSTVVSRLTAALSLPAGDHVCVGSTLSYVRHDPYAVLVGFSVPGSATDTVAVEWTFARELLTDGSQRATGDGDVKAWPSFTRTPRTMGLSLSSPGGLAVFHFPLAGVQDFLLQTYDVVPLGSESDFLDFDVELNALMSGAGGD